MCDERHQCSMMIAEAKRQVIKHENEISPEQFFI